METSELVRSLVHVAGPPEREPTPGGHAIVQRCLRCDELLVVWVGRDAPPRNAFRVGRLVAADAYHGISESRYTVDDRDLRDDERPCSPLPVALL